MTVIGSSTRYDFLDKENEHYKDTETLFQQTNSKDEKFKCVFRVCYAIVLKLLRRRLPNIGEDLVYDKALDATIKVVDRIERLNIKPAKLTSYCYWPSYEACFGTKQKQFEDKIIIGEDYSEEEIS